MPYRCTDCRSYFSVRTGTAIARSNVPLRKWAIAIYLCLTSLKSVSSMKLHRDLGVSRKTAWFMLHRIREAWASETRGAVGKMAVAGVKDRATRKVRAQVVPDTTGATLRGSVQTHSQPDAMVYTDGESYVRFSASSRSLGTKP